MQHLCSRAGTLAMTAGGLVLLSLPVVALAKGPPDAVGGGTDTARTVVSTQAKVPDPPPGQLHNSPQASKPAPRPHPRAQTQTSTPTAPAAQAPSPGRGPAGSGPARRGPKTVHPGQGPKVTHPGRGPKAKKAAAPPAAPSPEPDQSAPGGGSGGAGEQGGGKEENSHPRSGDKPNATGDLELPRADTGDTAGEDISGAMTGDTVELPADASPETLPFTGLQLLLITMTGLAAIGGGAALRRRVQRGRA